MIIFGRFAPIKQMKFYKNYQVQDEFFEYKFIDKGLIVEICFEKITFIKKIVSLKIQDEIEIYLRLLLQGQIKKNNAVKNFFTQVS